ASSAIGRVARTWARTTTLLSCVSATTSALSSSRCRHGTCRMIAVRDIPPHALSSSEEVPVKPFCCRFLLCLTAVTGSVLLGAAPPSGSATAEVQRLIGQLGSEKFTEREAASKRLMEIGEPALDAVTDRKST